MRKFIMLFLIALFIGCNTYEAERITTFVKDPHYADYKQQMDELERSYLEKDISYSEYLQRKNDLEENYTREVQRRESIIHEGRNE